METSVRDICFDAPAVLPAQAKAGGAAKVKKEDVDFLVSVRCGGCRVRRAGCSGPRAASEQGGRARRRHAPALATQQAPLLLCRRQSAATAGQWCSARRRCAVCW
jgi:hypothetical protein